MGLLVTGERGASRLSKLRRRASPRPPICHRALIQCPSFNSFRGACCRIDRCIDRSMGLMESNREDADSPDWDFQNLGFSTRLVFRRPAFSGSFLGRRVQSHVQFRGLSNQLFQSRRSRRRQSAANQFWVTPRSMAQMKGQITSNLDFPIGAK